MRTEQVQIRKHIGYCPQHDALLELLTVREHLQLYARAKGVEARGCDGGRALAATVDAKMTQLDLHAFADKTAGSLSGGNKRKLSVAIATIGSPSVVFLDEPSTGMDPVARRFMWRVLSSLSSGGGGHVSLVLTTHSMEEAEALCSRIGIMVNGQLRCLGSTTHLKNRFGGGLELDVTLPHVAAHDAEELGRAPAMDSALARWDGGDGVAQSPSAADLEAACQSAASASGRAGALGGRGERTATGLTRFDARALRETVADGQRLWEEAGEDGFAARRRQIRGLFCNWFLAEAAAVELDSRVAQAFEVSGGHCTLLERPSARALRYKVATAEGLGQVFRIMEDLKAEGLLSEYSAGQTTLEQIFNRFASSQENPEQA